MPVGKRDILQHKRAVIIAIIHDCGEIHVDRLPAARAASRRLFRQQMAPRRAVALPTMDEPSSVVALDSDRRSSALQWRSYSFRLESGVRQQISRAVRSRPKGPQSLVGSPGSPEEYGRMPRVPRLSARGRHQPAPPQQADTRCECRSERGGGSCGWVEKTSPQRKYSDGAGSRPRTLHNKALRSWGRQFWYYSVSGLVVHGRWVRLAQR